jgi:hypothetical protein
MTKIKILSGWSNPGGSTHSLMELTELFNERGLDCSFYGPHDWHLDKCKYSKRLQHVNIRKEDIIIGHYLTFPQRPDVKRIVLSCHEKTVFPLKNLKDRIAGYDAIRFISDDQKEWQGFEGVVIPNTIRGIEKVENPVKDTAGVIGTVSEGKGTHLSIERALKDGNKKVLIYGNCLEKEYFSKKIEPLLEKPEVEYKGMELDRQKIYDSISAVYQTNQDTLPEAFGRVKAECSLAGIEFCGNSNNDINFELWSEDKVFSAWENLLEL